MGSDELDNIQLRLPAGKSGKDLVVLAAESYDLDRLFKLMLRHEATRRLLFLSKHDLFHLEDEHQMPVLHACRSEGNVLETFAALAEDAQQGAADLQEVLGGALGPSKGLAGLVDAFAYGIFAAGMADKQLHDLIASRELSFARWRKLVRQAGGIDELLSRLAKAVEADLAPNEEFQRFVKERTAEIARIASEKMDELALATRHALPDLLVQLHGSGLTWINRIQEITGLTIDEIEDVLAELVKLGLVETKSAVVWCPSCQLDRPAYQILAGTWAPKRYADHACFVCKGRVNYAAILYPLGDFRDALLSRDGLLAAFIAWKLIESNRLERSFFDAGGRECDYLTKQGTLIEVKMFQTSRDSGTLRRSLGEAANLLKRAVTAVRADVVGLQRAVIVSNLPAPVIEHFNSKVTSVEGIVVEVIGGDNLVDA